MLPEPLDHNAVLPWESDGPPRRVRSDAPGVSVVIPIYNAGPFLEKTIRSLLCQDLNGVELIVMDGASTDETPRILEHYQDYFAVCVSEPDSGQSNAINKGFARATKRVLYWLNGDDLLLRDALAFVREEFAEAPECEVLVGDAYMTEKDLTPIRHCTYSQATVEFNHLLNYAFHHLVQPSVFFTREAWEAAGPLDESLEYAMDADLFLAMTKRFTPKHVARDIAYSVYHEDCKTRGKRGESITELALVQTKHGGFSEARQTLDLLVGMFNDFASQLEECHEQQRRMDEDRQGEPAACERCHIAEAKLHAVEEETKAKRAALLQADMEHT